MNFGTILRDLDLSFDKYKIETLTKHRNTIKKVKQKIREGHYLYPQGTHAGKVQSGRTIAPQPNTNVPGVFVRPPASHCLGTKDGSSLDDREAEFILRALGFLFDKILVQEDYPVLERYRVVISNIKHLDKDNGMVSPKDIERFLNDSLNKWRKLSQEQKDLFMKGSYFYLWGVSRKLLFDNAFYCYSALDSIVSLCRHKNLSKKEEKRFEKENIKGGTRNALLSCEDLKIPFNVKEFDRLRDSRNSYTHGGCLKEIQEAYPFIRNLCRNMYMAFLSHGIAHVHESEWWGHGEGFMGYSNKRS